jgi:hypothetical protein
MTDATTPVLLTVEADRAARVLMRKSAETQRTYQGVYIRFAGWLAEAPRRSRSISAGVHCRGADHLTGQTRARGAVIVKKKRAALRKLARYLPSSG